MRNLNLKKKNKIFLLLFISILIFSSLSSVNTFYKSESNDSLVSNDEMEFNLNEEVQFNLNSIPKWKEQNSKSDKNENGIDDNFEVRLKHLSEFGFIEENIDRDKEHLDRNYNYDDIIQTDNQKTEKITIDDIPIIIYFPNGDYDSISLLFETLGGKIKSTYKAALNGFAGRISYNPLNEFCDLLIQNDIPFFIEEDKIYEAQLYYAGRNMNLRPYVWNTLSYDGDECSSIAIIDTGIDDSHSFFTPGYSDADFNYKIVGWRDEVNGLASPYDDNGHGSHCSGISAGEGGPNYDGTGRTVATAAYEWDYTGGGAYSGSYIYNWTRFNVTDPGLIEFFCEFEDLTPGSDDVDFWAYLYYGETIVDSYEVNSDSWSHTLSYSATSSDLGLYSFRFNMILIDNTGDGIVSDFHIRFRNEMHWPFNPNLFGSGDAWKGGAPDTHLVGVKVLDQHGSGSASDIVDGINWVITNKNVYNITTMSLSLGGSAGQTSMINAVNNAVEEGIVTVVSAGNSGPGGNNVGSPGDADNVITVAAMSIDDEITDYSSQGGLSYTDNTIKPDITAPGGSRHNVQMFSTDTNDNDAEGGYPTDAYANDLKGAQGTSMSAPAVAGASNLLIEAMGGHQSWGYTGTEAKRVKALLLMSATETYPLLRETFSSTSSPELNRGGKDVHEGYGRLNIDVAIEAYTQELALGSTQNAWIASSFDNPFNKHGLGCYVNLNDGKTYNFTLDVPVGADFDLHLYSNNPSSIGEPIMVASSTSSGLGTDEIILFTATETGKYYLIAKAISGEGNAIISSLSIAHDLSVSLEVPTNPEIDQTYIINATVTNAGSNVETNVDLFLYLNSILNDSITGLTLPVGASETIDCMWTPTEYGEYNFTAYAPPVPSETILVNNIATELVSIFNLTVAILSATETPGYFNGGWNNNYQSIYDGLIAAGKDTIVITNADILSGALSGVGVLILIDNAPNDAASIVVKNWALNGGGVISFDSSICFLNWAGLIPPEAEGTNGYETYWDYGSPNQGKVVDDAHPVMSGYSYGDDIYGSSGDAQYFSDVIMSTSAGPYYDPLVKTNIGTNYDLVVALDAPYSGKVVQFWDYLHWDTATNQQMILNAIEWVASIITDHDLSVSLEVPTNPEIYQTYIINATVTNTGSNVETNVDLFLYLDSVLVNSTTVSTLPVDASDTINYMWTPTECKTYNFTAYAPPVPDESYIHNNIKTKLISISFLQNYTMILDYAYTWIDASGGTELFLSDDGYSTQSLPFDFQFYNETYSTIYLGANGYLSFTDTSPGDHTNDPIPSGDLDNYYLIAPFWDDLLTAHAGGGGTIYVQSFGTYWVAEWQNIEHYPSGSPVVGSFEVILYESGEIVFNYDYIDYVAGGYTCGLNLGKDVQYYNSYQGLTDLTDDFAIQFTHGSQPGSFDLSSNAGTPDKDGVFDLIWTSAAGAQNYSVYEYSSYITEINGSLTLLIEGTVDLTHPISGYSDGTYYFIVVANNSYGGTLSNCIEVVVEIGPPGDFILSSNAGTPDNNGVFDLTWESAEAALNYSVYEYSSYITEINGSLTLLIDETEDLTLPLSGYLNGTYYFIVVAHNDYGDTLSNCLEVVVELEPPGAFILSSNAGIPDRDGVFNLTWTSAAGAQNYSVYEYSSYITEINESLTLLIEGTVDLTHPLSGYSDGTYYFIVVAYNASGNTLSNCIEVVVEIGPPGDFILSSNAGTPDDNGAFDLTWTSAEAALNYSVYEYSSYITEINGSLTLLIAGTTDLTLPLSGYSDGTYYFIVVANNSYGGTLSNCIEVVVQIPQPTPPGSFVLSSNAGTPDDNGAFDLSWTSAAGAVSYSVYEYSSYITEINGSLTLLIAGTTDLTFSLSGYSNGTYYFIVVAYNAIGNTLSNCIEVVVQIPPEPDPEPEPTPPFIPGYNIFIFVPIILVVVMVIIRKPHKKRSEY